MQERERQEAEQREKERAEREAKEKAAAELTAQKQEMDSLFGEAQVQTTQYQAKTSVKKRINVLNPEGFMQVVGMWWAQCGCTLSVAELEKSSPSSSPSATSWPTTSPAQSSSSQNTSNT